jgi:hypothetical protein
MNEQPSVSTAPQREMMRPVGTGRFNRGSWLTLAAVLGFTIFCVIASILNLRQPSDGCVVSDYEIAARTIDACYGDWETSLRHGDVLLAVAGIPLTSDPFASWASRTRPAGWEAGRTAEYRVQRGGETLTLAVPLGQLSWRGVARVFVYTAWFGSSLEANIGEYLLYLSAAVIFALAPRSIAAQLLCFGCSTHFAVTKLGWAGIPVPSALLFTDGILFVALFFLTSFWIWAFWPSLLLLVISFPRRVWPVSHAPRLVPALIYGIPLAVGLFTLVTGNSLPYIGTLFAQFVLLLVALVAVTAHTFARVRDRTIRAQTGWLLLGLASYIVPIVILYPLALFVPAAEPLPGTTGSMLYSIFGVLTGLMLPVCLGIAITRYRLFDIDVVIRRTLVYTLLTLMLGAVYLGSVVTLQNLFVQLTGQESTLAVVASTLGIASLFGPLRARVQDFIDRRFFRHKYDAAQVVAAFASRAQNQAELDTLAADVLGVVRDTLEPDRARVWIVR